MKKTLTVPANWRSMGKLETQKACDLTVSGLAYLLANRLEQTTGQLSEDALFQLQGALGLATH